MRLLGLHASALADSPPHNKNAAPGQAGLDFVLPSVQLAVHHSQNVNLSYFLAELKRRIIDMITGAYPIAIDRLPRALHDDPRYNNFLAKVVTAA